MSVSRRTACPGRSQDSLERPMNPAHPWRGRLSWEGGVARGAHQSLTTAMGPWRASAQNRPRKAEKMVRPARFERATDLQIRSRGQGENPQPEKTSDDVIPRKLEPCAHCARRSATSLTGGPGNPAPRGGSPHAEANRYQATVLARPSRRDVLASYPRSSRMRVTSKSLFACPAGLLASHSTSPW